MILLGYSIFGFNMLEFCKCKIMKWHELTGFGGCRALRVNMLWKAEFCDCPPNHIDLMSLFSFSVH